MIMGGGKSSAAINFMNDNKDKKFIYVTPYLNEAKRIKDACPDLHFVEPSKKNPTYGFSKKNHTAELIKDGHNVATTHASFRHYDKEMIDDIISHGYTLIMDECVDMFEKNPVSDKDIIALQKGGYFKTNDDGSLTITDDEDMRLYKYGELWSVARSHNLIRIDDDKVYGTYYWVLQKELIEAFDDVYVLTYLFSSQSTCHMIEMYGIDYEYIGVKRTEERFEFCPVEEMTIPEYVENLADMIHIYDGRNIPRKRDLNLVGKSKTALSMGWFDNNQHRDNVIQLKNNLFNYFNHLMEDHPCRERMWATHKKGFAKLRGSGYTKGYVVFNERATNKYAHKRVLAYCSNVYLNTSLKIYYMKNGIDPNEDEYALSTLIQWIWRSAIRNGEEIWIYIPSKRMRELLQNWIKETQAKYNENKAN